MANNGSPPKPSPDPTSSPHKEDMTPVPTVDVQDIIPTLEGIPIKATAIQKHTFVDPKPSSSRSGSKSPNRTALPLPDQPRSDMPKPSSKEQTLKVLAAHETDRLTMHAGHTPSHSLSVLPKLATSAPATGSGNSAPTHLQDDYSDTDGPPASEPQGPVPIAENHPERDHPEEDHLGPMVEPDEDPALRGPLMVRNMPVHDEVFFKQLSDKLEEVSKASGAAVPAVLKDNADAEEPSNRERDCQHSNKRSVGDTAVGKDRSSPTSSDEEMEIPLKLKKRNNFGAPFGEFR